MFSIFQYELFKQRPLYAFLLIIRYSLEVDEGILTVSVGFEVCVSAECQGHISLLDESSTALPHCYPNGTATWDAIASMCSSKERCTFYLTKH